MANVAERAIERSESHDEIVTIDYSREAAATLAAECDDFIEANEVTEYWANDPDSEDGMTWRVHMRHPQLPADAVIVETMPDQHRDSHRAAGNWGTYPHNGAERRIMSRSDAEELCEGDADGYASIVRDATEADLANYEVVS